MAIANIQRSSADRIDKCQPTTRHSMTNHLDCARKHAFILYAARQLLHNSINKLAGRTEKMICCDATTKHTSLSLSDWMDILQADLSRPNRVAITHDFDQLHAGNSQCFLNANISHAMRTNWRCCDVPRTGDHTLLGLYTNLFMLRSFSLGSDQINIKRGAHALCSLHFQCDIYLSHHVSQFVRKTSQHLRNFSYTAVFVAPTILFMRKSLSAAPSALAENKWMFSAWCARVSQLTRRAACDRPAVLIKFCSAGSGHFWLLERNRVSANCRWWGGVQRVKSLRTYNPSRSNMRTFHYIEPRLMTYEHMFAHIYAHQRRFTNHEPKELVNSL